MKSDTVLLPHQHTEALAQPLLQSCSQWPSYRTSLGAVKQMNRQIVAHTVEF